MLEEIGMVEGELPSRDAFLRDINQAGNYAGLGGIIYWQITDSRQADTFNFAYSGDGGKAAQEQLDWANARVRLALL